MKGTEEVKINPVDEWAEFSLNPQPYEEIRDRALKDAYDGGNRMCYAYISYSQPFTEEQIEELSVISSTMYKMMSSITPENIAVATSILSCETEYDQLLMIRSIINSELLTDARFVRNLRLQIADYTVIDDDGNKIIKHRVKPKDDIHDRLDWKAIGQRKDLSPEFRKKYERLMRKYPISTAQLPGSQLKTASIRKKKK